MKIGFIITARLKSTRLPKKLLLPINGKTIMHWMIKRLQESSLINEIIIATSTNPQDKPLMEMAEECGVTYFRGSENDVVERLYEASKASQLDYIINITADCPLVAYDYIPKIVKLFEETNADLITSLKLPHGLFMYGIKPAALKKVIEIKDQDDTEVWGRYFTDTGLFTVKELEIPQNMKKEFRLTIDYPEDYEFFKKVYEHFGEETYRVKSDELVQYLSEHPEIVNINLHCKEKYAKRWKEQNKQMKIK